MPYVASEEGRTRAVLRGIDTEGDAAALIARIQTTVPIIGGSRRGKLLFLTFQGRQPPKYIYLSHIRVPVEQLTSKNLQCGNCCRFGHVRAACRGNTRCPRCAGTHPAQDCAAPGLRCCNCGGAHWATAPSCPARASPDEAASAPAPPPSHTSAPPRLPDSAAPPASGPKQTGATYACALRAPPHSAVLLGEAKKTIEQLTRYIECLENGEQH